jgi:hypothetical protein
MLVTICRLYDSCSDAGRVVLLLQMAGVSTAETSIVANNSEGWYKTSQMTARAPKLAAGRGPGERRSEGTAACAAIGATATAAGTLITMLAPPGVGVVVGAGWLAAMLGGIAVNGVAGARRADSGRGS